MKTTLISVFSIFFVVVWCNFVNNVTGENTEAEISETTETTLNNEKNICDTCKCTVDMINCTGLQLSHHFENSRWPLHPLRLVTFEKNSIVNLKPFPNVTIHTLILRHNRIAKIDDKVFKNIQNLTELDLSHNQLTSDILRPECFEGVFEPEAWRPLPDLRGLNLGHNSFHTLNQDLFEHLPQLEVLILSGNPLGIIDLPTGIALSSLNHLKELCLEYCELQTLPDHLFHVHKWTLKKLFLNGNRFTNIPVALGEAASLEYLNFDDNPFQNLDHINGFPKLPMLKQLSMCSLPHLTHVGRAVFSQLTSLENLALCDCPRLQNLNEDALVLHDMNAAIWPPLRTLDISNNQLKYLPANLVGRWDKLTKLDITGNEWSCDCENQYLVGTLIPTLGQTLMGDNVNRMFCSAPPEHAGKNMTSLEKRHLRCLDHYGARPERDAAILVGLLIGILLAIPVVLTLFLLWRRGFLFCGTQHPASFSRAFYKRAARDDEI